MKAIILIRNFFRGLLISCLIFSLFFVKYLTHDWSKITYAVLGISLLGMVIFEVISYYLNRGTSKEKHIVKSNFKIIYFMTIMGLFLVVAIRDNIKNEAIIDLMNFYFWYCLGLVSAMYLFRNNRQ
jgi:FtsH-binding integral membrane protein